LKINFLKSSEPIELIIELFEKLGKIKLKGYCKTYSSWKEYYSSFNIYNQISRTGKIDRKNNCLGKSIKGFKG
jgi:hypothetical protein